jgi:hypothetical protein
VTTVGTVLRFNLTLARTTLLLKAILGRRSSSFASKPVTLGNRGLVRRNRLSHGAGGVSTGKEVVDGWRWWWMSRMLW